MSGINLHIILGNVGKIETRYTTEGKAIVNMSIATSENWKDQSGNKQEKTHWHNVVVFGKPAEIISKYVSKGDKLYISGKVVTRKWQDQSGNDRYSTETVVDGFDGKFELLGSKKDSQQSNAPQAHSQQNNQSQRPTFTPEQPAPNMPNPDNFVDDSSIPF